MHSIIIIINEFAIQRQCSKIYSLTTTHCQDSFTSHHCIAVRGLVCLSIVEPGCNNAHYWPPMCRYCYRSSIVGSVSVCHAGNHKTDCNAIDLFYNDVNSNETILQQCINYIIPTKSINGWLPRAVLHDILLHIDASNSLV